MNVAIVKYNAGNIYSVVNALKRLGVEPILTDSQEMLQQADRVIFPGQGEARGAMEYLRARRLDEVIRNLQQPVLGICIGQQLLCRHSEEGDTECIGVFDAEVKRFQPRQHEEKVPCMGWNMISDCKALTDGEQTTLNGKMQKDDAQTTLNGKMQKDDAQTVLNGKESEWHCPLFKGLGAEPYVYFVHSYYVPLCSHTAAVADYVLPYSAALQKDNFYTCQFHPEKSGQVGERIIQNFLEIKD